MLVYSGHGWESIGREWESIGREWKRDGRCRGRREFENRCGNVALINPPMRDTGRVESRTHRLTNTEAMNLQKMRRSFCTSPNSRKLWGFGRLTVFVFGHLGSGDRKQHQSQNYYWSAYPVRVSHNRAPSPIRSLLTSSLSVFPYREFRRSLRSPGSKAPTPVTALLSVLLTHCLRETDRLRSRSLLAQTSYSHSH